MEGGSEEGARAANEILSDYKAGIFPRSPPRDRIALRV
jgi:hypothetical protein